MTAVERAPVILLVDDNADHRTIYAMALEAAGFQVIEAADGTSAVRTTMRPDVIVLDFHMPHVDGWQACRRLKASKETSRIPVVALTADLMEQAEREAWQAGCDRLSSRDQARRVSSSDPGGPGALGAGTMPRRPSQPNPEEPSRTAVLPMQLRPGDRFTDETGEWEIVGRPYGMVGGKLVHARVLKVGEPAVTEERTWSAYERVVVRRG